LFNFIEKQIISNLIIFKNLLNNYIIVLKLVPNDDDALKAKVITHIHLGEYQKAIDAIIKADKPSSLLFELSYSYYRSDKLEEALEQVSNLLDDSSDDDLKNQCLQLKAQIVIFFIICIKMI